MQEMEFYSDRDIAKMLKVSPSWVRGQRFNRRHGRDHCLDVDPVMVGSLPRYAPEAIEDWVERIKHPASCTAG